mmetsp:Transcript_23143/g.65277  ORF Transcript_23143/g.65277 Transcript_23143/m.65277 type:complete len:234 (-) Transcript_23143:45-746(-)
MVGLECFGLVLIEDRLRRPGHVDRQPPSLALGAGAEEAAAGLRGAGLPDERAPKPPPHFDLITPPLGLLLSEHRHHSPSVLARVHQRRPQLLTSLPGRRQLINQSEASLVRSPSGLCVLLNRRLQRLVLVGDFRLQLLAPLRGPRKTRGRLPVLLALPGEVQFPRLNAYRELCVLHGQLSVSLTLTGDRQLQLLTSLLGLGLLQNRQPARLPLALELLLQQPPVLCRLCDLLG